MKIDARTGRAMVAALCLLAPAGASAADAAASESDRFFLAEVEGACRNGDFAAFLWPFANSEAVRARYGASATKDFPIVMIDYSYVTAASARRFEAKGGDPRQLVHVQVDFTTPSPGIERVDWVPGRFEPGEGDGPGTLIEKTGPGGHLRFRRTADCWQLTGDIRNPAGAR
jgi:hypothetical protein